MSHRPSYGLVTDEMLELIREVVTGRTVYDLGAGTLGRAHQLAELGAKHVVAVDKNWPQRGPESSKVEFCRSSFEECLARVGPIEVAFVAWPANHPMPGLIDLCRRAEVVCYLGLNDSSKSSCAWPDFFKHLVTRKVRSQISHPRNALVVYGNEPRMDWSLLDEERFGLVNNRVCPWTLESPRMEST